MPSVTSTAIRLGAAGVAGLLVAYGSARAPLLLNLFWLGLLLALAVAGGLAWGRPRLAALAGEAALAVVLVQSLTATAAPPLTRMVARTGERAGVSWRLAFSDARQAAQKTIPRPPGWDVYAVYVRVDLGAVYDGPAGFTLTVNDAALGRLDRRSTAQDFGPPGLPLWALRVPRGVLAASPVVTIAVAPDGLDPRLSIAGHGDARVEALGEWNSWLFDGQRWRNDRLAGPTAGSARGTYRIWLFESYGERA